MADRFDRVPDIHAKAKGISPPADPLEQLSYGLGDGFTNQLAGMLELASHPINSLQAIYGGVSNALQHPGDALTGIKNSLAQGYQTATGSPYGFGLVAGEYMNPRSWMKSLMKPNVREMTAYHGTPHTFEPHPDAPLGKFDLAKIGTGEGAQAYGHGIYVAENPKVAGQYAEIVNMPKVTEINKRLSELSKVMDSDTKAGGGYRAFKSDVGRNAAAEYDALMSEKLDPAKNKGNLYHVDIPDEHIERMLDWDKPLSEQSPAAIAALQADERGAKALDFVRSVKGKAGDSGRELYKELAQSFETNGGAVPQWARAQAQQTERQASEHLASLGISGIKYLDAGSRSTGGTRNLVLFDPGIAKIIKKE